MRHNSVNSNLNSTQLSCQTSSARPDLLLDQSTLHQVKSLLWINKLIKLPASGPFAPTSDTSPQDFNEMLSEVICSLSQEFVNHRHELVIAIEACTFGATHKKVRDISPFLVLTDDVFYSAGELIYSGYISPREVVWRHPSSNSLSKAYIVIPRLNRMRVVQEAESMNPEVGQQYFWVQAAYVL